MRIFSRVDTDLYSSWHYENSGVITIYVPGQSGITMTLAKAEELAESITRQVKYGREAAKAARNENSFDN